MKIWLADLTYTQATVASDVVPAAIGMLAEYLHYRDKSLRVDKLIKYPEDLIKCVEVDAPDIIGFSNYVWNSTLSLSFAMSLKEVFPNLTIIFGGPNFPDNPIEQEDYLLEHDCIDFYVAREGEHGFYSLVKQLCDIGAESIKAKGVQIDGVSYTTSRGRIVCGPTNRLPALEEIPSPYLNGSLDEFLDGRLMPVVQTARGCPFTCTFCTEGLDYWNKVRHKDQTTVNGELQYIAGKMAVLPDAKRRLDLLIADSNFGMFREDIETCRQIGELQETHGYPNYINVATGKNRKERVLEAAKLVKGAMKFAGSVQSLDPEVQKNIKRSNISAEGILEMAMQSNEAGANSYSEVILGLPGDTLEKHRSTLRSLVEARFNTISMYTLMMLMGTELGSPETRARFSMGTRYRVIPRCFGSYELCGKTINSVEIEEVCVSNSTLSFEDYLSCRRVNLFVNILYNDAIFEELFVVLKTLDISVWDWIEEASNHDPGSVLSTIVNNFLDETRAELWESKEELESYVNTNKNMDRYFSGELGGNLIFKYKAITLIEAFDELVDIARMAALNLIEKKFVHQIDVMQVLAKLVNEVMVYKSAQVCGIFNGPSTVKIKLGTDIKALTSAKSLRDLLLSVREEREAEFSHDRNQLDILESYGKLFGKDIKGVTRTLSRVYLKRLFRSENDETTKEILLINRARQGACQTASMVS